MKPVRRCDSEKMISRMENVLYLKTSSRNLSPRRIMHSPNVDQCNLFTMKKLFLILIPIIFLSSCSIDWNDEKDKKIEELESQIMKLREKNSQLEQILSGATSSINEKEKRIIEIRSELDAIIGDTFTQFEERLSRDVHLKKTGDAYEYKSEVFDGKNT
jgi:septal ring factor EnvC (AmiA/AmiB activator)